MTQPNNYQFIIDEIPDESIDEFLNIMRDFANKTHCRFQYKEGKGIKHPLHPVPPKEETKMSNHIESKWVSYKENQNDEDLKELIRMIEVEEWNAIELLDDELKGFRRDLGNREGASKESFFFMRDFINYLINKNDFWLEEN